MKHLTNTGKASVFLLTLSALSPLVSASPVVVFSTTTVTDPPSPIPSPTTSFTLLPFSLLPVSSVSLPQISFTTVTPTILTTVTPTVTVIPPITPIPSAAPSSPSPSADSFESQILSTHNSARVLFQAQPLAYNTTLATASQSYSQNCQFVHSDGEGAYGENLAEGYTSPSAAVQAWVDEYKQYTSGQDGGEGTGFSEATGHFTQVVWKGTTDVGCGSTNCPNGMGELLVCRYWPAGNVIGNFGQNVGTMVSGAS